MIQGIIQVIGKMSITIGLLLLTPLLLLAGMGLLSHYQEPELGLYQGALHRCPDKPNCVCSENGQAQQHAIDSLEAGPEAGIAWSKLLQAVDSAGGRVVRSSDDYLHAEFSSLIFRFVDDLEARLDRESGRIHLRSASRVGHSDFGANRKRVEAIRLKFKEIL